MSEARITERADGPWETLTESQAKRHFCWADNTICSTIANAGPSHHAVNLRHRPQPKGKTRTNYFGQYRGYSTDELFAQRPHAALGARTPWEALLESGGGA